MNICIVTDLEGVSDVDTLEMIPKDGPRRQEANALLMADVNAVAAGGLAGHAWAYRFPEQRNEASHAFVTVIQAAGTEAFFPRTIPP